MIAFTLPLLLTNVLSALLATRLMPASLFARAMSAIPTGVTMATVCTAPICAWMGGLWALWAGRRLQWSPWRMGTLLTLRHSPRPTAAGWPIIQRDCRRRSHAGPSRPARAATAAL